MALAWSTSEGMSNIGVSFLLWRVAGEALMTAYFIRTYVSGHARPSRARGFPLRQQVPNGALLPAAFAAERRHAFRSQTLMRTALHTCAISRGPHSCATTRPAKPAPP